MGKNNKAGSKHLTERIEDSGLTITQERVAVLLATGLPVLEISRQTSVPTSTIYKWRQQAAFATYYKRLQREVVREIRGQLSQMSEMALSTIRRLIEGGGEQAQLKASCYVLDYMTGDQRESKKMKLKAQQAAKNEKK
jgi:transposase-like protein